MFLYTLGELMNRRALTGLLILACLLTALAYLWQPWNASGATPLKLGLDLQGGLRVVLQADGIPNPEDLDAARNVIENRINQFGVSEPVVQTSGQNRVVVELPGLSQADQQRALDLIGQQAVLEFRLVKPASVNKAEAEMTSADLEPADFTGEILQSASTVYDQFNQAIVSFQIRNDAAQQFGEFTGNNIGRRMAIVLDGNVISAPTINGRISSDGQITGQFTVEEASDLVLVLRSGSLPINLQTEEIRTVGPSLGADSVNAGLRAGLIGAAAVVVAVIAYFGPLFGIILALGLVYAMLLTFGALAGLGAVLTLPGIAGLVLTIGSAVDGNVISFERVKEELRDGKGLRLALKTGFANSLSAILDANATALLAAGALYQYTSGPVRGFAVTWAIGLVAAVFVNTVVVPFTLNLVTQRVSAPRLPHGFYASGFNFLGKARLVIGVSALLVAASVLLVATRDLNFSTDFTGGSNVLLAVPERTTVDNVRDAISSIETTADVSGGEATVQEVEGDGGAEKQISVRVGLTDGAASEAFATDLASTLRGRVLQTEFVGPAVGADLRTGALLAVGVALALILAYISFRFWPTWIISFAAVTAVVHDLIVTIGILTLLNAEFSIPVLAALLSVVGYSLNDKIVLADRVRENLKKMRGRGYAEVVNTSVNETLSRTLLTLVTTLLPVLALLFFGGSVLRNFSLTLLLGISLGAYSSTFILSPLIVWFKNRQGDRYKKATSRTAQP